MTPAPAATGHHPGGGHHATGPAAAQAARAARLELGRHLARLRNQASLTQRQLARHTGYSPSVIAAAETGQPHISARFWQQADDHLNASGQLTTAHQRARLLDQWARHQHPGPQHDPDPGTPPGRTANPTITTAAIGACPSCGHPLAVTAHLTAPAT